VKSAITVSLILLLLCSQLLLAQSPVKKDLMQMLHNLPAPPATVAAGSASDAKGVFTPVDQQVKAFETEYEATATSGPTAIPGMSAENAQKMKDPEMKKKMKSMSKEEKMKMAMEMMKSANTGTPALEADPPAVRAALDEWQKIVNSTQEELDRSVKEQEAALKEEEADRKAHDEIDAWQSAEIAKLPQISSGEMSAPDPALVKVIRLKGADRHIALANKRLGQIRLSWNGTLQQMEKRYGAFHEKLVAADYAAGSKNFSTRKVLSDGQLSMLEGVRHLVKRSKAAWDYAASWQRHKDAIVNGQ
jgi:hypothetical protein